MESADASLRERRSLVLALEWMQDDPVLLLEGPRSVGKSTLLRQIAEARDGSLLDLDDPAVRDAVTADPGLYVGQNRLVCIDEYQKAPVVLDAIKHVLNRGVTPGRFVLAGSARHDSLPPAAQALTGRLSTLAVHPLSQGELAGVHERFVEQVLTAPGDLMTGESSTTSRRDYIDRITTGGFPLSINASSPDARQRWMDNYLRLTVERDVRELSRVRQGHQLTTILERLAGQTAQVLNVQNISSSIGLDRTTTESYITLLEKVFLLHRLPAWGRTLTARSTSSPKVHVVDSGIAARLVRLTPERLATPDPAAQTEFGHLLESFVVGELRKQLSWISGIGSVGHWRTHDGLEVDLVVEAGDGRVVGFEVKAGSRVQGDDLRPLRSLRDALGSRFAAGFVLHLGEREYNAEDRLYVAPVDRLWR